jgi:D-alanine transaminase
MVAYYNGEFLPRDRVCISPDDRGFLFADGLYEVIRSYRGNLFQLSAHIERLNYGAREIRLKSTDFGFLAEVAEELIRRNGLTEGDALVYLQVTRGSAPRKHRFPPEETPLTVFACATPFEADFEAQEKGIKAIFVPDQRWARTDIKSVGLLPNVLAQQRAYEEGAQEAIFLRQGAVMEGTHSNALFVFDGVVTSPPRTNYILEGITRKVIRRLCSETGIPYREAPVFELRARRAEEVFITGTTVEVMPVVRIDGHRIADGKPGEVTRRLQESFRRFVQRG